MCVVTKTFLTNFFLFLLSTNRFMYIFELYSCPQAGCRGATLAKRGVQGVSPWVQYDLPLFHVRDQQQQSREVDKVNIGLMWLFGAFFSYFHWHLIWQNVLFGSSTNRFMYMFELYSCPQAGCRGATLARRGVQGVSPWVHSNPALFQVREQQLQQSPNSTIIMATIVFFIFTK